MDPNKFKQLFQIKTKDNISSEKQIEFPSNYIKEKCPQLHKVVPKNSILYRVKYKPDISISDYFKLSNSKRNLSINIKTDPSSEVRNSESKQNFISQNKMIDENISNTLLNELEENEVHNLYYNNIDYNINDNNFYNNQILYEVSPIRNTDFICRDNQNVVQKFYNDRNNLINNKEFNNYKNYYYSIENTNTNTNTNINTNPNINNGYNNKINKDNDSYQYLNTENITNKFNIFNSPINMKDINADENIQYNNDYFNDINENDNINYNFKRNKNLYLKNNYRNLSLNIQNSNNNSQGYLDNYKFKIKTPTSNILNIKSKEYTEDIEPNIDSYKNKYQTSKYLSPRQYAAPILEKNRNKCHNHFSSLDYINNRNNNNINNEINIKLDEYRVKLFREFYKHFKQFYKLRLKKYFYDIFINNIKIINSNRETEKYYNNKVTEIKKYKTITMTKVIKLPKDNNINNSGDNNDTRKNNRLIKDYRNLFKKLNKKSLNLNNNNNLNSYASSISKSISLNYYNNSINNHSINNHNTSINNNSINNSVNNNSNNMSKNSSKKNYNIKSVPKEQKYNNNLSIQRNTDNRYDSNSFSPSIQLGNRTIIVRNITFKNEGNIKENELYRDSKELNKKYIQIQTRKKIRSKLKDKDKFDKNNTIDLNRITKSTNVEKIDLKSEIDSQFSEIRRYMKSVKKNKINKSQSKSKDKDKVNNKKKNNISNKFENNKKRKLLKLNNLYPYGYNNIKENNDIYNYSNIFNNSNNYENNNNNSNNNSKVYTRNKKVSININKKIHYNLSNISNNNKFEPNNSYNNTNSIGSMKYNKNNNSTSNYIIKGNKYKITKIKNIKSNSNYNNIYYDYQNHSKTTPSEKKNIYYSNYNNSNSNNDISNTYNNKSINNKSIDFKNNNKKIIINNYNIISMNIKNILTKDKRIHININYYFLFRKNKPIRKRYNFLHKSDMISICYIYNKIKKYKEPKLKLKLSEIKEEEFQSLKNINDIYDINEDDNYIGKNILKNQKEYLRESKDNNSYNDNNYSNNFSNYSNYSNNSNKINNNIEYNKKKILYYKKK